MKVDTGMDMGSPVRRTIGKKNGESRKKEGKLMRLILKKKLHSLLDGYTVHDMHGERAYTIENQIIVGRGVRIFDETGKQIGCVKEHIFAWAPRYDLYAGEGEYLGCLSREVTSAFPRYHIDYNGWRIDGNLKESAYEITDADDTLIARIQKEPMSLSETYILHIENQKHALSALMVLIAIETERNMRRHMKKDKAERW